MRRSTAILGLLIVLVSVFLVLWVKGPHNDSTQAWVTEKSIDVERPVQIINEVALDSVTQEPRVLSPQSSMDLKKFLLNFSEDGLPVLDEHMQSYLLNDEISREEKISTLWSIYEELKGTTRLYVLDTLWGLGPIELCDEMKEAFEKETDSETRLHLLRSLVKATSIEGDENLSDSQLDYFSQQTTKVQDLTVKVIHSDTDPRIVREAVFSLPSLFPPEQSMEQLTYIDKAISTTGPDNERLQISQGELTGLQIEIALATEDSINAFLPQIIQRIKSEPELLKDTDLQDVIFSRIPQINLSPELQVGTHELLKYMKPDVEEDPIKFNEWATVNLYTGQDSEAKHFALLLSELSTKEKAVLVVYQPKTIVASSGASKIEELADTFLAKLGQNDSDEKLYKKALTQLIGLVSSAKAELIKERAKEEPGAG